MLEYLKNHADYIALHNYVENRSNDYYKFMATTRFAEKAIRITEGLIAEAMTKAERKDPIYIAFDEYNVWYRAKGEEGNEEVYNLEDALVVSTFLNIFVRNAHVVKMANMAQLVNVIAPIFSTKEGSSYQTIFYRCSSSPRIATARRSTPSSTVTPMRWAGERGPLPRRIGGL